MLMQEEEGSDGLNPSQRMIGQEGMPRVGGVIFPGRAHQLLIQYRMVPREDIPTSHVLRAEQVVFVNLGTHADT